MAHQQRRSEQLVCPVCDIEDERPADWCPACGAYLGLLRRHPRRVAYCICASIAVGLALFVALAWQVFGPLLRGWPAAGPGPWFWWGFCLATFFLALGLTARQHLTESLRKLFRV
ncbi:MAG: hypothetical protein JSV79_07600 [Armatimonadota bacterium]|nr:MAG: hypothetical protein JSV79_07600 [Armatimonadota bacterium]